MSNRRDITLSAELEGGFLTWYATVETSRGPWTGAGTSIDQAARKALELAATADADEEPDR